MKETFELRERDIMKKWILILLMDLAQAQMPGSEMDARFLTDEEREERQENPPDGLGKVFYLNTLQVSLIPTLGTTLGNRT